RDPGPLPVADLPMCQFAPAISTVSGAGMPLLIKVNILYFKKKIEIPVRLARLLLERSEDESNQGESQ
ncbi:MAG: hypothetical protein LPK08_07235, partial [Halomonas sp.]|nr:hypothetical protein [Halomonas sp.]MDX5502789.1 hypothetical protein [Halomonas sp.]